MRRTSLFLDDALLRALKRIATRRGVSVATVVREAAAAYVADDGGVARVPAIAGQYASGHGDTSARVDDLLWTEPHH